MSFELERLAAEFEKFQTRIQQAEARFGGVAGMQDRISRLEASVTSPDRTVRVVAGAGGAVKDIELTPAALRQPAPALAATIMSTLRAAVAEAVRLQAGIVTETVGGDLGAGLADQVKQAQREALADAVDELSAHHDAAAAPPPKPSAPRDEDDFSQNSVYSQRKQ